MRADHTRAELSLGNHVREFLEPEPYASFGRGEWDCLRGAKHTRGGAQITKRPHLSCIPLPRTHLPSPWLRMQKHKMHGASWHYCKGHHLLISITVSWTSYDTRAWAGKWVAGSTAGQLGIAQPLKTMLCSPRQAKASGPGSPMLLVTVQVREAPGSQESSGHLTGHVFLLVLIESTSGLALPFSSGNLGSFLACDVRKRD